MFKRTIDTCLSALLVAFIAFSFTPAASAQTRFELAADPTAAAVDAPLYPHDFSDTFYELNGVHYKGIAGRLTGTDLLSTFSKADHPAYRNVRVLITIPGYSQTGEPLFFSPLGKLV